MRNREANVLVIGVFDLFHRGHLELLKTAKGLGGRLYVVINGDAFTTSYKRQPVIGERDRCEIVRACKFVDHAEISNSPDAKPFVERLGIDIIVHGDDWQHESYLRQIRVSERYLRTRGVRMVYTPYYPGESTSKIIDRIFSSAEA
jgi:glycerol-3-phosphate cytidylyltransferase